MIFTQPRFFESFAIPGETDIPHQELNLTPPAPVITAPAQDTPRHDLVQTDGRWYRIGQTNPFTGCMTDVYPGGELLSRSQISDGLLSGLSETWYTSGQMQVREHFRDGVSDGLREKWHENGELLSRATIAEGKVTGTF